jgi:predicted membrane protein
MKSVGKDLIFIKIQLPSSFTILLIDSIILYIFLYIFPVFFYSSLNNLLFLIKKIAFYKNFV